MTRNEKTILQFGMVLGAVIAFILVTICITIDEWKDPVSIMHPNAVLNSDNYRIDTITTICNDDTTLTYKFIKK